MADANRSPDPALGVFDTLLARDGVAVDLDAHVGRLAASVRELYDAAWRAEVTARIVEAAARHRSARVRTSYHPGGRRYEVAAEPVVEPGLEPRRLAVRRVAAGMGAHKWTDRRLVALRPAAEPPAPGEGLVGDPPPDDVLLVDASGLVLECGTANVFAVVGSAVVTPALDGRILPGTLRHRVLAVLRAQGVTATEGPLALHDLAGAAEVFTTSSVRGVQPVAAVVGVGHWPVGRRTAWLRERTGAGRSTP